MSALYIYATQYTRQMMDPDHKGVPTASLMNWKSYRTTAMKADARARAYKSKDSTYRSPAPTCLHTKACTAHKCICR